MRRAGGAETRRVFVSVLVAATLHGALFVAIDRRVVPDAGVASSGRGALLVEVTFAPAATSRGTPREEHAAAVAREAPTSLGEAPPRSESISETANDASIPVEPSAAAGSVPPGAATAAAETSSFADHTTDLSTRDAVSDVPAERSVDGRSERNISSDAARARAFPTIEPERYVEPRYPEAAQRAGLEGTVALRLSVDRRGRVVSARITESSGVRVLDTEALRAARLWRFPRGADDRQSVHRIRFSLEER